MRLGKGIKRTLAADRRAVTALEYALIAAAIVVTITVGAYTLGSNTDRIYDRIWDQIRQHHTWNG